MNLDQMNAIVQNLGRHKDMKGAVLQIDFNGESNHPFCYGNLNENSRFYIASINKLITSGLILRLVRDRKLKFDDRKICRKHQT